MRVRLRTAWESITEPRHLKVTYLVIYLVVVYTGVVTLIAPPRTIEGVLGSLLSLGWSGFLIVGGLGGLMTVLPGWWWAERLSILMASAGIGIYGATVFGLQVTQSGSRLTQLGVIALALSVFVVRWTLIRRYSFEPRTGRTDDT